MGFEGDATKKAALTVLRTICALERQARRQGWDGPVMVLKNEAEEDGVQTKRKSKRQSERVRSRAGSNTTSMYGGRQSGMLDAKRASRRPSGESLYSMYAYGWSRQSTVEQRGDNLPAGEQTNNGKPGELRSSTSDEVLQQRYDRHMSVLSEAPISPPVDELYPSGGEETQLDAQSESSEVTVRALGEDERAATPSTVMARTPTPDALGSHNTAAPTYNEEINAVPSAAKQRSRRRESSSTTTSSNSSRQRSTDSWASSDSDFKRPHYKLPDRLGVATPPPSSPLPPSPTSSAATTADERTSVDEKFDEMSRKALKKMHSIRRRKREAAVEQLVSSEVSTSGT